MIIYKITNLVNGKIYIGQDSKNNPNYLGSGNLIKSVVKEYGKENFKKETLEVCYSKEDLDEKEKYWINKLDSTNSTKGYNISFGGQSGWMIGMKHNEKSKEKMSKSQKGKKTGLNNPMYGKKHRDNSKKKMGKPKLGEKNPMYGKKHTEETIKKISNKTTGEKNPFFGKKHSENTIQKIKEKLKNRGSVNGKKIDIDGQIFNSIIEVTQILKISRYILHKKCTNKTFNCNFIN